MGRDCGTYRHSYRRRGGTAACFGPKGPGHHLLWTPRGCRSCDDDLLPHIPVKLSSKLLVANSLVDRLKNGPSPVSPDAGHWIGPSSFYGRVRNRSPIGIW